MPWSFNPSLDLPEIRPQRKKTNVPPSQMNPATTVHLLVEELISYLDA